METKRFDWTNWTRKLSTLVAALTTVAGSALAYYSQLDPVERAAWPWWVPLTLAVLVPVLPMLVPAATSYKQPALKRHDTDQAGA